jgi:hypothetical protein
LAVICLLRRGEGCAGSAIYFLKRLEKSVKEKFVKLKITKGGAGGGGGGGSAPFSQRDSPYEVGGFDALDGDDRLVAVDFHQLHVANGNLSLLGLQPPTPPLHLMGDEKVSKREIAFQI